MRNNALLLSSKITFTLETRFFPQFVYGTQKVEMAFSEIVHAPWLEFDDSQKRIPPNTQSVSFYEVYPFAALSIK